MILLSKIKQFLQSGGNHSQREHNHEEFDLPLYEWKTPVYHQHERGLVWLITLITFFIGMLIYAINAGSASMATAVILLATVYYLVHREPVQTITVKISRAGLKIGKKIISFSHIKGYWLNYHPPLIKQIHFRLNSGSPREITILLSDADQEYIRHILAHYIPEWERKDESLIDIFARALKL